MWAMQKQSTLDLEVDGHDIADPKCFATVRALSRPRSHSFFNAFLAEKMPTELESSVLESSFADIA